MKTQSELRTLLRSVDHKSYPAYKSLAGVWKFDRYVLVIDHVQGDPFAAPSSLHVEVAHKDAKFPAAYYGEDCVRIALQDYLVRQISKQFEQYNFKAKGSGKSGLLSVSRCGQAVLERSACQITESGIIARFHVGFPAFGRTINAGELEKILFEFLPRCVENSFFYKKLEGKKVEQAIFQAGAISKMLDENLSLQEIAKRITGDENVKIIEENITPIYQCDCSKEHMAGALATIGKEELQNIIETEGKAELVCHFCNEKYQFTKEDLAEIIKI